MRLITVGLGIAALLATSVAAAAPQGGGAGQKGDTGGKGGLGPENSTQSGAEGAAEQGGAIDTSQVQFSKSGQNPDTTAHKEEKEKPWEISGSFETHHLLEQNFLTYPASLKTFNVYSLAGRYLITPNDIVSIGGGAEQVLQADPGETGWRLFDIGLAYTHRFALPEKFNLSTTGSFTLPISYGAQVSSEITSFGLGASLSRKFGDLFVSLNLHGGYIWDKYEEANGLGAYDNAATSGAGATNTKYTLGGALTAEYSMPFHRPWSVGAVLADSYRWLYSGVGQPPADSQFYGATSNPTTDGQPTQQSYGGEIFTRYILPDIQGFKTDITLALANGDPSLGYPSVIHDGVVHPYFFYYNTTEVYLALSGRY